MASPKKEANRPGHQFEQQVATLLRLFGYSVEPNIKFRGNQIDIKATVDLPTHRDVILVECKDYGRNIGIDTVRSFYSIVSDAPNDVRGLLVAREEFTAEAREFAEQTPRLSVAAYKDLERRVIDPALYLQGRVKIYPHTAIATVYVDLGCKDLNDTYRPSAERALLDDINNPDVEFIALLGEYGSGKTTLLDHLEHSLAASYLSSGISRIPLRVNLGEYTKALNLRQLITDLLVHRLGVRGPRYETFEALNEQGRLLLLFDGFDEMSSRVDDVVVRENFSAIQMLCVPGSKVILTCRTSFFRSRQEEASLFGMEADQVHRDFIGSSAKNARAYWLSPLTWKQIEKVVHNAARHKRSQRHKRLVPATLLERIRNTYNLQELAQRPFLLDMIIHSVQHADLSAQALTAGLLYEIYTEAWVRRDARKGRTLETPERRLFFAEELALTLFKSSLTMLHWAKIPEWINEHLGVRDSAKDYYDYDVRSSNFLSRNEQGYYYFAHRSFMEFFVAKIVARLVAQKDYGILSFAPLSEEVRQFMIDLSGNELGRCLWDLVNLVRLEEARRAVGEEGILLRNVLGLVKQAGIVRSVVPILVYLRQGSDRGIKAFLQHHLAEAFDRNMSPALEVKALLAALSVVVWGQRVGLDPDRVRRVWGKNAPSVVKRESRWVYRSLRRTGDDSRIDTGAVFERLSQLEQGLTSVTIAEIAFALNVGEADVLKSIKMRNRG